MSLKAVNVLISGRVQGVFFRHWSREQAARLGVKGWVRNRYGGEVEGHFEGPEEAVDALVTLCRSGPPIAVVDNLEIEETRFEAAADFAVRPSA